LTAIALKHQSNIPKNTLPSRKYLWEATKININRTAIEVEILKNAKISSDKPSLL
jgi:hypothetical protein